jgi:hypothetical protein
MESATFRKWLGERGCTFGKRASNLSSRFGARPADLI